MKKTILNIGKALNKVEQRQVSGGMKDPCPCSSSYDANSDGSCSYPALFPEGFRCFGDIQNGLCCIS
ncbi:MAG: hypothetical protein JKY02_04225 [Flavobacteriaceae bacterium]|nr:hypothetical protein [Flavobacteriaceae bacterium]